GKAVDRACLEDPHAFGGCPACKAEREGIGVYVTAAPVLPSAAIGCRPEPVAHLRAIDGGRGCAGPCPLRGEPGAAFRAAGRVGGLQPAIAPGVAIDAVALDQLIEPVGRALDERDEPLCPFAGPELADGVRAVARERRNHLAVG